MENIRKEQITIWKDEYIFKHYSNWICRIDRISNKAYWWFKEVWWFKYKDDEDYENKKKQFIAREEEKQQEKEKRKEEKKQHRKEEKEAFLKSLKEWDLLHDSRGYSMIINEFYQITKINWKKVYFRKVWKEVVSEGRGYYWEEKAIKDNFIWEEICKPVLSNWIKIDEVVKLRKWERNKSYYFDYED